MLEVGAEAESFEGCPDCLVWLVGVLEIGEGGYFGGLRTEVLVHGVGVVGPGLEVLCEDGEFLLEGLDVCWVFVEEDLVSMSATEHNHIP